VSIEYKHIVAAVIGYYRSGATIPEIMKLTGFSKGQLEIIIETLK